MTYSTLISAEEAYKHFREKGWAFIDCRFDLREPEKGFQEYESGHIPGAVYAHLDRDLSGPIIKGKTGRHPLPSPEHIVETFSRWGIDPNTQVVAYDQSTGAMAAARLWWLLRWAGHSAIAVLDGGLNAWIKSGYPMAGGVETREPAAFTANFDHTMVFDAVQVQAAANDPAYKVVDARGADRYRGENETIDPVAGHIPGAISGPFIDNLNSQGSFKSPAELAENFDAIVGSTGPDNVVFYCGSGVTAAHSALSYVHSGKGMPHLYPGSWSEWITDPTRPVAKGK